MADTSKQCNITNNSGRDIIVALAITPGETTGSNTVVAANGGLEVLKTSGGDTVIKNGSSGTVTLDHSYTNGADGNGYVPDYNLQICDGTWANPVALLPVAQQTTNGATGFGPQTIAVDNGVLNRAVNFYQTITVYPASSLAKDYAAAMQHAAETVNADGGPESAKAISDAMSPFFESTINYKDVTLADVVAVTQYYNNFPAVWAQYKDSMTYYLYGSNGGTALFAGTLFLLKSGAMDVTKAAGGYNCIFMPAYNPADMNNTGVDASKAVILTYTGGWFVDDPKTDMPKIGLRGSFLLKRVVTGNPADTSILTVIDGAINGSNTIGLDTPQRSSQAVLQGLQGNR